MKILMVLDEEFPPDGRVEREMRCLIESGHTVHLLCYSLSGISGYSHETGLDVFRVAISKSTYKFKALALQFPVYFRFWRKKINEHLKAHACDVIHFHDLNLAKVALQTGRLHRMKVVGDYHENRPEIMKLYRHVNTFPGNILISVPKWQNFQIRQTRDLDHLILVTDEAKDYYSANYGISPEKISVVENFPDLEFLSRFHADPVITEKYRDKKVILYFGDTGLRRGTDTIIEAARLLREYSGYHFVIVGTSSEQPLLSERIRNHALENIELTGELPMEKAASYFHVAWAGLCPFLRNIHHDTTYANKLFQYMAFGIPVVASDCTAQENVIRESVCGLIHEAGNAAQLAEKIRMVEDDGMYSKMSGNARNAVRIKYNFEVSKKKLINLYTHIADEIQ